MAPRQKEQLFFTQKGARRDNSVWKPIPRFSRQNCRRRQSRESKSETGSLEDEEHHFNSNEPKLGQLDAGTRCGCRFGTLRGLMAHETHAHGARGFLSLFIANNQFSWCRTTFSSRDTASRHTSAAAEVSPRDATSTWRRGSTLQSGPTGSGQHGTGGSPNEWENAASAAKLKNKV